MREHQIVITLKPEQFLEVQRLSRAAGAKSMGIFVRQKLLAALGIEGAPEKHEAAAASAEIKKLTRELRRLHSELKSFVAESLPMPIVASEAGPAPAGSEGQAAELPLEVAAAEADAGGSEPLAGDGGQVDELGLSLFSRPQFGIGTPTSYFQPGAFDQFKDPLEQYARKAFAISPRLGSIQLGPGAVGSDLPAGAGQENVMPGPDDSPGQESGPAESYPVMQAPEVGTAGNLGPFPADDQPGTELSRAPAEDWGTFRAPEFSKKTEEITLPAAMAAPPQAPPASQDEDWGTFRAPEFLKRTEEMELPLTDAGLQVPARDEEYWGSFRAPEFMRKTEELDAPAVPAGWDERSGGQSEAGSDRPESERSAAAMPDFVAPKPLWQVPQPQAPAHEPPSGWLDDQPPVLADSGSSLAKSLADLADDLAGTATPPAWPVQVPPSRDYPGSGAGEEAAAPSSGQGLPAPAEAVPATDWQGYPAYSLSRPDVVRPQHPVGFTDFPAPIASLPGPGSTGFRDDKEPTAAPVSGLPAVPVKADPLSDLLGPSAIASGAVPAAPAAGLLPAEAAGDVSGTAGDEGLAEGDENEVFDVPLTLNRRARAARTEPEPAEEEPARRPARKEPPPPLPGPPGTPLSGGPPPRKRK